MIQLMDLVLLCLAPKSTDRPSIDNILLNKLFQKYCIIPCMKITPPTTVLLPKTNQKLRTLLSSILHDDPTIDLSLNIYSRILGMINANDRIKLITCAWIAHKIIHRDTIQIGILHTEMSEISEISEILEMERAICNYLSYRLL